MSHKHNWKLRGTIETHRIDKCYECGNEKFTYLDRVYYLKRTDTPHTYRPSYTRDPSPKESIELLELLETGQLERTI